MATTPTYLLTDTPTACPDCGSIRTIDVDMAASDPAPEPFAWCDTCNTATFLVDEPTYTYAIIDPSDPLGVPMVDAGPFQSFRACMASAERHVNRTGGYGRWLPGDIIADGSRTYMMGNGDVVIFTRS